MIDKGLIAWYKLNKDFNDSSGNNYHAQERKRGECDDISFVDSDMGTCASFDGRSVSIGNYIETPFKLQEDELTVSMWINKPVCSWNTASCSTGGSNEILCYITNRIQLFSYSGVLSSPVDSIVNNTWQHIVFTITKIDSIKGSFNIYIDGTLSTSIVRDSRVNDSIYTNNFVLGMDWDTNTATDFYKGLMKDVRIYNRELTLDEIKVLNSGFNGIDEYVASIEVKSDTSEEIDFNMTIDNMYYSNKEPVYSYGRYHNLCDDFNIDEIMDISEDLGILEIEDNNLISNRALNLKASFGSSSSLSCLIPIKNLIPNKLHTVSFKYRFIYKQRGFVLSIVEDSTSLQSVSINQDSITHYRISSFVFTPSNTTARIKIEIPVDVDRNAFSILFGDFQINVGEEIQQYSTPNNKSGVLIDENTINMVDTSSGALGTVNNASPWGGHSISTEYITTNTPLGESDVMRANITYSGEGGGGARCASTRLLDDQVEAGKKYTHSFYYRVVDDWYLSTNLIYIREYRTDNTQIREYGIVSTSRIEYLPNGWKKMYGTFTAHEEAVRVKIEHYLYPNRDLVVEIFGEQLEKKEYHTEFTPSSRDRQYLSYPFPYKLNHESFSIYGFFRANIDSDIMNTDNYYYTMMSLFNNENSERHLSIIYRPGDGSIRVFIGHNSLTYTSANINGFSFNKADTIFYCVSITPIGINLYAGVIGGTLYSSSTSISELDLSGLTHLNLGMSYNKLRQNNGYNSHIHILNRSISLDEATYLFNSNHMPQTDTDTVMYLDFNSDAHEYKHRKTLYNGYTEVGFNKIEGVVVPTKGAINYDFEVINKGVGSIEKRHLQFEKGSTSTSYTSFGRNEPSLIYPITVLNKEAGTISFWIKILDEYTDVNPIFTNGQTEGFNAFDLLYGRYSSMPEGRLYYRKYNNGIDTQIYYDFPSNIHNKWTHIAVTYENGEVGRLYVNGELVRATVGAMDMTNMGDFFAIGSHIRDSMNFKMDELKIDNVVRNDSEILTYYNTIYPFYPRGDEYTIM